MKISDFLFSFIGGLLIFILILLIFFMEDLLFRFIVKFFPSTVTKKDRYTFELINDVRYKNHIKKWRKFYFLTLITYIFAFSTSFFIINDGFAAFVIGGIVTSFNIYFVNKLENIEKTKIKDQITKDIAARNIKRTLDNQNDKTQ